MPRFEATYLTDPDVLAAVLPPPLEPSSEPRVHVRFSRIDFNGITYERVGSFLVDALYNGNLGQYTLVMPIDLETAVAPSRERFGEPKKLAQLDVARDGEHVHASITRQGVTFIELEGDCVEALPLPAPYPLTQFWFKFLPAVSGKGFDAGPFLVTMNQIVTPTSCERVDGKLELRDLPGTPVVDLPVLEMESMRWMTIESTHSYTLEDVDIDPVAFERHIAIQYA
jgi:acetoacetate decarboxylase